MRLPWESKAHAASRVEIESAGKRGTGRSVPSGSITAGSPAEEAPFHALQLMQTLMELLPEWLPEGLFRLLMARWRHPDRAARCNRSRRLSSATGAEAPHCLWCLFLSLKRRAHEAARHVLAT